jgi:hypothetical protein
MRTDRWKKKGSPKEDRSNSGSKSGSTKAVFKPRKKELKFTPLDPRFPSAQASYASVKEALVIEITKEYDRGSRDVVQSIFDEKKLEVPKPELEESKETADIAKRDLENKAHEYLFREKAKRYTARVEILEDSLLKAYGLIWSDYMTPAMVQRIEQHPEYATKIRNDPIELLLAIRASMHEAVRSQKKILTATQALIKFITHKQADSTLKDYIKDFKELRDVFAAQWGDSITIGLIDATKYALCTTKKEREQLREEAF